MAYAMDDGLTSFRMTLVRKRTFAHVLKEMLALPLPTLSPVEKKPPWWRFWGQV